MNNVNFKFFNLPFQMETLNYLRNRSMEMAMDTVDTHLRQQVLQLRPSDVS